MRVLHHSSRGPYKCEHARNSCSTDFSPLANANFWSTIHDNLQLFVDLVGGELDLVGANSTWLGANSTWLGANSIKFSRSGGELCGGELVMGRNRYKSPVGVRYCSIVIVPALAANNTDNSSARLLFSASIFESTITHSVSGVNHTDSPS